MLEQWNVIDQVRGMSVDTDTEICTLLEARIGRKLLWVGCRHHMLEIILLKVFKLCFGPSSFLRLRYLKDREMVGITFRMITTIAFIRVREQNRLLKVLLKILIRAYRWHDDLGKPHETIYLRSPWSIHQARWMEKFLYAMQTFLFRW